MDRNRQRRPKWKVPPELQGFTGGGLPRTVSAMDSLMTNMVCRIREMGSRGIGGAQLARELHLADARALRKLIAYARTRHRRHEIVGSPGEGYFWGPSCPDRVRQEIERARRMGRCFFYIGTLLKRQGAEMAAVQMVLDFMERQPEAGKQADDLAALVAADGVTVAGFLDAFLSALAETDEGREALAAAGKRHAEYLLPEDVRADVLKQLDDVRSTIAGLPGGEETS